MKCGEECEIVEYVNAKDITVKFIKTGEITKSQYCHFKKRTIKSHLTPTVFAVGIVGMEEIVDEEKKIPKSYQTWKGMLERCYSQKYQEKHPTYMGCKVCDEWLYYPNFKKWYDENYYEIEGQRMELDKDILVKNNKVYSPDSCVFVPNNINVLFTKNNKIRGKYPIGVHLHKQNNKYCALCGVFDIQIRKSKQKHLGLYDTPKEAFQIYKITKEDNIKLIADFYKDSIPEKLYDAMYKYKVEIDD